jgi:hypothetical protein
MAEGIGFTPFGRARFSVLTIARISTLYPSYKQIAKAGCGPFESVGREILT